MLKHYILLSETLKYKTEINQQLKRYTSDSELDWPRLHREDRQDRNVAACFFTNKNIICLLAERIKAQWDQTNLVVLESVSR